MFKKIREILILISLVFLLTSCFTEHIANTKDNKGSLVVTGKWPASTKSASKSISKGIHADTATIVLKMTQVDGTGEVTKTITRASGDDTFEEVVQVEAGTWKVTLTAKDSDGNTLNSASKTVTITSEITAFNAVFGPATYAELFLPTSFGGMTGDYTEYYEMLSSLGISQRDITVNGFSVGDPLGCFNEWDNTDQCAVNVGTGTHTYAYNSNNKITSYSKDETEVYTLDYNSDSRVSKYTKSDISTYTETRTMTYNSQGLIEKIKCDLKYNDDSYVSSETIDYSYSDGNLVKVVKILTYTYTYGETTYTYIYKDVYEYTWENGKVVAMTGKYYDVDSDSQKETLSTYFERKFVSESGGVLTWQETQYNTSDETTILYQWSLVYTDDGEDGTIDSFVRTLTNDTTNFYTEYTISFTYENGKVKTITYTNNNNSSYTATETLSYRNE